MLVGLALAGGIAVGEGNALEDEVTLALIMDVAFVLTSVMQDALKKLNNDARMTCFNIPNPSLNFIEIWLLLECVDRDT